MWWGNWAGIDSMWWGNWPKICWAERCCLPGGSCEGERPEAADPSVPGGGSSTCEFRLVAKRISMVCPRRQFHRVASFIDRQSRDTESSAAATA
jgi:hypothetical protein